MSDTPLSPQQKLCTIMLFIITSRQQLYVLVTGLSFTGEVLYWIQVSNRIFPVPQTSSPHPEVLGTEIKERSRKKSDPLHKLF